MKRPLENVRVLDLTRVLAGPYCTMILGDLGAEIIKVEIPEVGDDSREFGPFINGESGYFMSINRNKKSMTLNLKKDKGKEIMARLIRKSDVLVENFRPGTLKKLGFGEERIKDINPNIIYSAISGYGHNGPDKQKPCYDAIAQARSGMMSITGPDEETPTKVGSSIADITSGMFSAIGILSALYAKEIGDIKGQKVDVAMLDSMVAILENALVRYFATGNPPKPIGNRHPSIVPFETFKTKNEEIMIAVGNDNLWESFCEAIERKDLIKNEKFKTNKLRNKNYEELRSIIAETLEKKNIEKWIEIFEDHGIPCSPVNDMSDVVDDEQIRARGMIKKLKHPKAGEVKIPNNPINLSETPGEINKSAPLLGENTKEILKNYLNYSKKEIKEFKKEKVI